MAKAKAPQMQNVAGESIYVPAEPKVKVKAAFLHQAITWPGVSGTERSIQQTKMPGVIITMGEFGITLELKGSKCLVPYANVANCILE